MRANTRATSPTRRIAKNVDHTNHTTEIAIVDSTTDDLATIARLITVEGIRVADVGDTGIHRMDQEVDGEVGIVEIEAVVVEEDEGVAEDSLSTEVSMMWTVGMGAKAMIIRMLFTNASK